MPVPEVLGLLAPSFIGCALFVAIHQCFGVHVLRRGVIFVDLALAQVSALGVTLAFAAGHDPGSAAGIAYTLFFAAAGAALLTFARALPKDIHPEAYIGIVYVVSTAATMVVVDRAPQGVEHVKELFIGGLLGMRLDDLPRLGLAYGAIGAVLWAARKPIGRASAGGRRSDGMRDMGWDFLFYLLFGLVVASSVTIAGVLLVFCFLIIPSIIGALFSAKPAVSFLAGWIAGVAASAAGLAASFAWDLPAGAALVISFASVLMAACALRSLVLLAPAQGARHLRRLLRAACAGGFAVAIAASAWLVAAPHAEQPVIELLERLAGTGPERFLSADERRAYRQAAASAREKHTQAERMVWQERQARWQGEGLSDEAVVGLGTFQQAFNEMARGEDFVVRELTNRAREREREREAPLVLAACVLGLWLVLSRRAPMPTPAGQR
ncbi:metal ABC transporter permease [Ramlibacter sp. AN1133]|uniref:metal ABC transporter permease n=1 Tax=Ramlibacter sp. AN1133 TaxID=3133429 RepID=UPI0030BDA644